MRERTTYIPLTFQDKLKFQLPTSSYYLFPHPFGHQSSLVHLMGSINPLFDHPRLVSRRRPKVLKSVKNQGYLFLFELPFSIIIRIVYYKFRYLSRIIITECLLQLLRTSLNQI